MATSELLSTRQRRGVSRRTLAAGAAWAVPAVALATPAPVLASSTPEQAQATAGAFMYYEACTSGVAAPHYLVAVNLDIATNFSTNSTWIFTAPDGDTTTGPSAACYVFYTPKSLGTLFSVSQGVTGTSGHWTTPVAAPTLNTATHYAYQTCSKYTLASQHAGFLWDATAQHWTADQAGTTADPLHGAWRYAFHPPPSTLIGCPCDDPTMIFEITRQVTYKGVVYTDHNTNRVGCSTSTYTLL